MPDIKRCHTCGINERIRHRTYCRVCWNARSRAWKRSEKGRAYGEKYRKSEAGKATYEKFKAAGGFKVAKRKYSQTENGRRTNKLHAMKYHFKRKYGMSLDDRDAMLVIQSYGCASCGEALNPEKTRMLHIDHCHKSGVVRGILCADCNISLGRMRENPARIRKLADYAEKIQGKKAQVRTIGFGARH